MGWNWRYETADGEPVHPEGETPAAGGGYGDFPSQTDAETWLGENWRALLSQGVDAVALREDERDVYGPMSLHPPT